jgi:Ca2+-binding RTX toxin-like protein
MCWICGKPGETGFTYDPVSPNGPQDFVLDGQKWGTAGNGNAGGTVTWSIVGAGATNQTGQTFFSGSTVSMGTVMNFDFMAVLNQAFASWSAIANIDFQFVNDGGGNFGVGTTAQIRIGAGFIDGNSNVLARAYNPGGSATNGDMIFDSGESSFWNASSFLAVAAHEIGHAIGIRHTSVAGSLMEPFYNPAITGPQADDIAAAQTIYGARTGAVAGSVTINDVVITEGNSGTQLLTFTLTRSGGTAAFNVSYATAQNTATAGLDFTTTSGVVSFGANVNTRTITVAITGDTLVEGNENFSVFLSNATNGATITDGQGIGTIIDDDAAPVVGQVSISDVTVTEGNSGFTSATFTVTRTGGTAAFTIGYATQNNSAQSGTDYAANSGTLSFGSGVNSQTITISVTGDTLVELNETFLLNLSNISGGGTITDSQGVGTILNDDVASGDDFADTRTDNTAPFGTATVGGTAIGNIETAGDRDWFQVTLTAGTTYRFNLAGTDSGFGTLFDPYLRLYNSAGTELAQDDDSGPGYESEILYTIATTGTYFLAAGAYADQGAGTYALGVAATATPADDFADSFTDTTASFGTLLIGGTRTGSIELSGDRDWFRVSLTAGTQYSFDLMAGPSGLGTLSDPLIAIYNTAGALVGENDDNGTNLESRYTFTPTSTGFFYVEARGFGTNFGTYTVSAVSGPFTNGADVYTLPTPSQTWRALNGNDSITGSSGADTIYGDAGNDTINGGTSNDYIEGGLGSDTLNGGADFDTVSWLTETGPLAVNLLTNTYEYAATGDSISNFEVYYLTGFGDSFTNNNAGGYIYGFAGADFLFGGTGSDFLVGGDGGDQINGGTGFDYASLADATAGVRLDLANASSNTGFAQGDGYSNVEAFFLTGFNDVFVGQAGANFVFGGNGDDQLFGGLNANDWLFGEGGTDYLSGGTLDDLLVGGAGSDVFAFASWVGNGFDVVLDFVAGEDIISLSGLGFGLLAGTTFTAGVTFVSGASPVYNTNQGTLAYYRPSGILYYDPDGAGAGAAHALAQFSGNPNLTANMFFVV